MFLSVLIKIRDLSCIISETTGACNIKDAPRVIFLPPPRDRPARGGEKRPACPESGKPVGHFFT
jgi:hypothetical protein